MTQARSGHDKDPRIEDPQGELTRLIQGMAPRWSSRDVFTDFVELSSLSISNAVDKAQFEVREARYLEVVKKYSREELQRFPRMLACLTLAMEHCCAIGKFDDLLGKVYMTLEMGNDRAGQFFTPFHISQLMTRILTGDATAAKAEVERKGFVDLMEPTCGAGGMVIAMADSLREAGLNYQQVMHATCMDIDLRCVHMTYLQASLLHIPAIVEHGNSLSLETWGRWYTPAHILGGWCWRLAARRATELVSDGEDAEKADRPQAVRLRTRAPSPEADASPMALPPPASKAQGRRPGGPSRPDTGPASQLPLFGE